jgi:hypothetical protein
MQETNHSSISSTCDFATNRNHAYFHITLQLLQISVNIFYAHHYFEITVVIRPAGISHVIVVFLVASALPFSMQLVKTTDISQCSQLFVFVRYVHADAIKGNSYFVSPSWKLQRLSTFRKW